MLRTCNKDFIKAMIEKHPIETLHIKGRLRNESADYYVDCEEKTQVCLVEHDGWLAPFSEEPDRVVSFLNHYIKEDHVQFCGLPISMAQAIIEGRKDFSMKWVEQCVLYYLPQGDNEKYLNISSQLESIGEAEIATVNKYYTYKGDDSLAYLRDCIGKGPSSLIRNEEGEPISWALLREDGSLGVMYTLEDYRKRGHAINISCDLIKKVIKQGLQPYVHIVVDNYPSRKLAEQLGMVHYDEVLWFGMERIK